MMQRNQSKKNPMAYYAEKIFSNALGKYIPSSTPILDIETIDIEPQRAYKVLDKGERGELLYVEIAANSTLIIPEIILYNDRAEPVTVVNKRTFQQLLALGRGMTPGDVQAGAPGQTQDWTGHFVPNMFHIARYKDDQLTDWNDIATENPNPDRYIVGRIVCQPPMPYSSITIYIKNTTTDSAKRVYSISVARTVYENAPNQVVEPNPAEVKSVEVVGDELDTGEDELVPIEPTFSSTRVNYDVSPAG